VNHRGRAVLWLSLIFFASLPPAARAERLPIKTYTTADGLAHNSINRIVKDSQGFLWFCTAGGLSRFDGYAFTNFGVAQRLPHSGVNDLLETRTGEYWVATDGGLVRFQPRGRPPFTVIVAGDDRRARITVLGEGRDGVIWVGTSRGLYRLDKPETGRESLKAVDIGIPNEYPEQRIIADVLEDSHGSLWVATPSGLYRRWRDGNAARYTRRDGLPHDFMSDLFQDLSGHLWAGTRLEGFFRFSADDTRSVPVVDIEATYREGDPYGLPTSWVSQLFESSDRRFLVATPRGLVEFFRSAPQQERVRRYSVRNGLSDRNVTALAEDLGGNLWIGTLAGAMRLARGGFTTYGLPEGIESVYSIFRDQAGQLCFRGAVLGDARTSVFEGATVDVLKGEEGFLHTRLGCFDGRSFDWFKPGVVRDFGWVGENVTLQTRSGEWWIATGDGLYRFAPVHNLAELKTARPRALYTVKDGLSALQVYRLFEDRHGNMWISTTSPSAAGLARWDHASNRLTNLTAAPGLSSLKDEWPARSFAEDAAGNLWIGFDGELVRYRAGTFDVFSADHGLPTGAIRDIHLDPSGRLWLASAQCGLIRVDNTGANRPVFVPYSTADGLSSNNLEVIADDTSGHIYVGGGHGVDRLDPSTGHVKHFTTADGLPRGLFRAAYRDTDGVLWFGMLGGLARLDPPLSSRAPAPPVLINGLRIRGEPQPISALGERQLSLADFAPDQNQLQIDFTGLSFASGEVLRYQYQLDGASGWSALSDQRSVTYASLSPGRYRFLVRAVNSDGIVSPEPATLTFAIRSPIWQRGWFLSLVVLAIGMSGYAAYRFRVASLLEIANMRTRIATDLHDDIGANLTRIALLSEVARQGQREDGPLASIARIARESVSSMSDIVWAINPKRESLRDLTRRMRQHADEIFTLRHIELHFTAPGAADSLKLGVDVRRDLLLIFKEAVNNAARHSRCSVVHIDLRIEGARLLLTVADNGEGFDKSTDSEGQGLTSMQRRAQRLRGLLEITSVSGSGTTVAIAVPL
jgi:ligand-binding sensor domain-containing protein/two-component sensor histidine kinase